MATSGSNGYELNWTLDGSNTVLSLAEIGDKLQINGYKENDFVITKSESGNLVLTDAKHGTITISNWPSDNVPSIVFSAADYTKELTGEQINAQLFNVVTLSDDQSYSGGTDTHQEFDITFSEATNITIDSSSSTEDRIKFTKSTDENWSVDNVEMKIIGNDFYIKNWDKAASKVIDGQVVIQNYMNSSVKTIEFEEYTYHLVTGTESYVGSDTIRDRYLFLDSVKNGSDPVSGDWNVTIEGAGSGKGDILDFHYLPNNMHYYGLYSQRDGRDMVLSYQYCPTPDSNLETLGTLRLKNYFNEDGSVNTDNGTFRIRTNREFYAGRFSSDAFDRLVWNQISGKSEDKNDRWLYLNTGTAASDVVDLADLVKPIDGYGWLYYAGDGDDTVTAHKGDIVYGEAGDDTLYAKGRNSDIHGGAGNDTITVRGENGENISQVVVRGEGGNDIINAYGSYHAIFGNNGEDEIHLRDNAGDSDLSHNSYAGGGSDNDKLYIHSGHDHRIVGGGGNDILYAYLGDNHVLNGGAGEDEIHIVDDGTQRSNHNTAFGGADNDYLYIENGGQNHYLFGDGGDDYLSVDGDNNVLDGGIGNDTIIAIKGNNNILDGGPGNDILTGGAGNDIFVHTNGNGNDTVENYTAGSDIIQINDGTISQTALVNNGKDVKYTIGSSSLTVKDGAGKTISLRDSRGGYTASNTEIILGSDFGGTIDAGAYLGTVTTVDGISTTKSVTIQGNGQNNTLRGGTGADMLNGNAGNDLLLGGAGDDVLNGGAGNDSLYGGAGTDTMYGGAGRDTFFHYDSFGHDTVADYTAGEDTLYVVSGTIGQTALVNNGKDVKYTIGSSSLTVKDGAGKTVSLRDSRGSYTASNSAIVLGTDFGGTIDAGNYLDTVTSIDGRSAVKTVTLKGNANDNNIYGGSGNDTLYSGAGNDYLKGGLGSDTYSVNTITGNTNISIDQSSNNAGDADVLQLSSVNRSDVQFSLDNGVLTIAHDNGGIIAITGWDANPLSKVIFANNTELMGEEITELATTDNSVVTVNESKTYAASGKGTVFQFSGSGYNAILTGTSSLDTLDFSQYRGGDYDIGDYSQSESGNDLVFTFIQYDTSSEDGENLIGTVTVENYFTPGSQIENFTYYNSTKGSVLNLKLKVNTNGGDDDDFILAIAESGSESGVTLNAGAGNDIVYGTAFNDNLTGGAGNDTLEGGDGSDTLTGGAGNDILEGGEGADTFVYSAGDGNDTITDYTVGEDLITITSGNISKTELVDNGKQVKDLKFTIGDGSITVKDVGTKSISLEDSRGSYTAGGTDIKLGDDFTGTLDANAYSSTVTTIDGRSTTKGVTITGNSNANTIYGGSGADVLNAGAEDSYLNGGTGDDTYAVANIASNTNITIDQSTGSASDADVLQLTSVNSSDVNYSLQDGVLTITHDNEGTISISGWEDNPLSKVIFADNTELTGAEVTALATADNSIVTVNKSGTYTASGEGTVFQFSGIGYNAILSGTSSLDTLDFSQYTGGDYDIGDYQRGTNDNDLNDLYVTFIEYGEGEGFEEGERLIGSFTVKDYFASENKIEQFTYYNSAKDSVLNLSLKVNTDGGDGDDFIIATTNGVTLDAGAGNDIVYGTKYNDNLTGGAGDDILEGGDRNDYLYGGTGNDVLNGGDGSDHLYGGAGDDVLFGSSGNDTLNGGAGNDILYGGESTDYFVFVSGDGNDVIKDFNHNVNNYIDILQIKDGFISKAETSGDDVVFTVGSGTVTLEGAKGQTIRIVDDNGTHTVTEENITLYSDYTGTLDSTGYFDTVTTIGVYNTAKGVTVIGNAQNNTIYDGDDSDILYGGDGNDTMYGYEGHDTMYGDAGVDTLLGGNGKDKLYGGEGADHLQGDADDDILYGEVGNDELFGGEGNDTLYGGEGDDYLQGDAGNDTLYGSSGNDTLYGGEGNDTFVFDKDYTGNNTISSFEEGNDVVRFADDMHITGFTYNTETNNAMALNLSTGGTVNFSGVYGKTIALKDHNDGDFVVAVGTFNDDSLSGTSGDDILYGNYGKDTLNGGGGNDTLYGGAGKDTFIYGGGEDVIKDYTENEDTLTIADGIVTKTEIGGGDLVFTADGGTVTLEGAAGKTVAMADANGSYTVSAETITLGSDYSGILNSSAYLSSVVTFDGSQATSGLGITGNSQDNVISGGAGNDVLTGGAGNDTFVYTGGNDVVTDYTAGQDLLQISGGSISGMAVTNNNDVVFTVGDGSVTLQNGAGKTISLKDENGSFTVSGSTITLGSDFTGSLDADIFSADTIYVGDCKGSVLTGGQGADSFIFVNPTGNHVITDYEHGTDVLHFDTDTVTGSTVYGRDIVLTLSGGATVAIQNQATHGVTLTDATNPEEIIVNPAITQQSVIKSFMKSLDDYPTVILSKKTALDALGAAVNYASNGVFTTWDSLIERFVGDVRNHGGSSSDILNWNVIEGSTLDKFLIDYCGINLHNEDTGAITGADAGGIEKTAVNIVPESGTVSDDLQPVTTDTSTINGLTFHWGESVSASLDAADAAEEFVSWFANEGTDSAKQTAILDRINTWWAEEGLNLVEESYGLSFTEEGTTVNNIDVKFYINAGSDTLASVRWANYPSGPQAGEAIELRLQINMHHFENFNLEDVNGKYPIQGSDNYFNLDRILAHEFTHASMAANINGISNFPIYFMEGSADLVHGIDDFRTYDIITLAKTVNANYLENEVFAEKLKPEDKHYYYSGGYMLLRYFAKQSAENYSNVINSGSSNILSDSGSDSIVSAASMLWTDEQPAAVADTGSELASSMASINNALLTPLDSTDSSVLGSDSLASDLFSDTNNKGLNFLG